MDQISSVIRHYSLITKGNIEWDITMAKAKERDRDFLMSYVESRTIPWQFEFMNVRYTRTCTMDTVPMTVFILWHQQIITQNALMKDAPWIEQIVKLIGSGDHVKARYEFGDFNLNCKTHRFYEAKKVTNPSTVQLQSPMSPVTVPCFRCTGSTQWRSAQDVSIQGQLRIWIVPRCVV